MLVPNGVHYREVPLYIYTVGCSEYSVLISTVPISYTACKGANRCSFVLQGMENWMKPGNEVREVCEGWWFSSCRSSVTEYW